MHIHILGICGTFMGGIAVLAKAAGHTVTGCDANVYPPMSTQLRAQGIELIEGYDAAQCDIGADVFIVGNAISRGNPLLEAVLDRGLRYVSGPQWLAENVLDGRWVLAVAGTHGKTTTSSMLAWILQDAGLQPGFLIGGVPENFGVSARLGEAPFFVIEADEYDTAFCDKRSKFVHYRPRTLLLNNLEYDHADIFPDLAAIETQFHHLVRTVPGIGQIIAHQPEAALERVLERGLWSELVRFGEGAPWQVTAAANGAARFTHAGELLGETMLALAGAHNRMNALGALLAARHAGVTLQDGIAALGRFQGVARRLQVRGQVRGVTVQDDFAHHPTAIAATLDAVRDEMRAAGGDGRLIAVFEPRSNTMKLGTMAARLAPSLNAADAVWCYTGGVSWNVAEALAPLGERLRVSADLHVLPTEVAAFAQANDRIVVMSNGGFGGIHQKLLDALGGGAAAQ